MKKILIIEDDAALISALTHSLKGHSLVFGAQTAKDGLQLALTELPDLILLDLKLPDQDGFQVCRKLRETPKTRDIPILMLTGEDSLEQRITGLDLGADDYVIKPCHPEELRARMDAVLRRRQRVSKTDLPREYGNLRVDPKSRRVTLSGNPVALTQFEFQLLEYFLDHPDEIIDRQRLLSDLWPDCVVNARTVDTHVAHLRRKLEGFTAQIETVHRAGYRLNPAS
jgi:two-component system phosphate regulon response regulator PhoB